MPHLNLKRFFSPFFLLLVFATLIAVAIQTYAFLLNLKRISPNDPITINEFFRSLRIGLSDANFLYVLIAFFLGLFIVRSAEKHSTLAKAFVLLGALWILTHFFSILIPVLLLPLYPLTSLFENSGWFAFGVLLLWAESGLSLLIWLLLVATLPVLIPKAFSFGRLGGMIRKVAMPLFGAILLAMFGFWYWDTPSPSIGYLEKEGTEKIQRIEKYYADPEFVIFEPTYLPEWADTITEEDARETSIFYSIRPEINGRMYFREYVRGLKITQYKPNEPITEEELYQKSLEHLEHRTGFTTLKNKEEFMIGQNRAVYYHEGSIEEHLNLYRNGQFIEITLNPNELRYHFRHNLRYLENKEMLVRIAESLQPAQ